MASTLQYLIPPEAPHLLGEQLASAGLGLRPAQFVQRVGPDFAQLGLMDRGRRMAQVLARCLPADFPEAAALLTASMGRPLGLDAKGEPVASGDVPSGFFYLPHSIFIAEHGLHHLDEAMRAQHALTQRFSAELSLRPFLLAHTQDTLAALAVWADDPSAHVRRAVSESTRPRLPWAARLPAFIRDPSPVLPLLTRLRDDPSSYVRRSVANHLNDIGKDHPECLNALAGQWLSETPVSESRQALLRHALRTAIKRGDTQALALFGHGQRSALVVQATGLHPAAVRIGERVTLRCALHNPTRQIATALADWRVHYVKTDGSHRPKVFKGRTVSVEPGATVWLEKTLSLRQMTTRTHHPGRHGVEVALNGHSQPVGHFDLLA